MRYSCPDPSCECILFPGLHYLSSKSASKDTDGKPVPAEKAPHDLLIAVFGLHPTGAMAPSTAPGDRNGLKPIRAAPKRSVSTSVSSQRGQREETTLPELFTFKHFGLSVSLPGDGNNAPSMTGMEPSHVTSNLQGHAAGLRPKKKPVSAVRGGTLPPIGGSNNLSCGLAGGSDLSLDDRLSHAEKARAELRKLDKNRLRKQREEREERSRRAVENNQLSAEAPAATCANGNQRTACLLNDLMHQSRKNDPARLPPKARKPTIQPIERTQYTPQQNDLNGLFISHR